MEGAVRYVMCCSWLMKISKISSIRASGPARHMNVRATEYKARLRGLGRLWIILFIFISRRVRLTPTF